PALLGARGASLPGLPRARALAAPLRADAPPVSRWPGRRTQLYAPTVSFGAEWKEPSHAGQWAARRARLPHRDEAESVLIEHLLPDRVERMLDLGTGDGHLLALIREARPGVEAVGLDLSAPMLEAARERFSAEDGVELLDHDLMQRLPADLG